jgi:hypothetical protein
VAAYLVFSDRTLIDMAERRPSTIDEFAHVPAGLLHWRHGEFGLYRNNPPLGKMWVAAPLAATARAAARPEPTPWRGNSIPSW